MPTTTANRQPMATTRRSYDRAQMIRFGVTCAVGGAIAASVAATALIVLARFAAHLFF